MTDKGMKNKSFKKEAKFSLVLELHMSLLQLFQLNCTRGTSFEPIAIISSKMIASEMHAIEPIAVIASEANLC